MLKLEISNSFLESLKKAESLFDIEKKYYKDPPKKGEENYILGLRGGTMILMAGSFESFLKNLFSFYIDKLNKRVPAVSFYNLGGKIRNVSLFQGLELAKSGEKYKDYSADKTNDVRAFDVLNICKKIVNGELSANVFCETGDNPNSYRVKKMFENFGVPNLFDSIRADFEKKIRHPVPDIFIKDKLDEIIRKRHNVAHKADALNISRKDIKEYFIFLKALSKVLEKRIQKRFSEIIKSK